MLYISLSCYTGLGAGNGSFFCVGSCSLSFTLRVILARSSWRSMMPCTRLRKSLQVGQAQRRKRKHQNREGKETKSKREVFRLEKIQQRKSLTWLYLFGQSSWWPTANKREASNICLLFVLGLWAGVSTVSIIKQQGVITCFIDQWQPVAQRWPCILICLTVNRWKNMEGRGEAALNLNYRKTKITGVEGEEKMESGFVSDQRREVTTR